MQHAAHHNPAHDPQELEGVLVIRQRAGDVDGMVALYEPEAVLDCEYGELKRGRTAIQSFFAEELALGKKYEAGVQRPAIISADLALTSTLLSDGTITAEVARRQADGTWLWVIDKFSTS